MLSALQSQIVKGFPNHLVRHTHLPLVVRPTTLRYRFTALPTKRADHFRRCGLTTLGRLLDTQTTQKPHSVRQRIASRRTPRQNDNPRRSPPRHSPQSAQLFLYWSFGVQFLRFATESVANRPTLSLLLSQADLATDAAIFISDARNRLQHLRFLKNFAAGPKEMLNGPNVSFHFEQQGCTTEARRHQVGTKNLSTSRQPPWRTVSRKHSLLSHRPMPGSSLR